MLRLKELRDAQDLSQEDLAKLAGVSWKTVQRTERQGTASMKTLRAFAVALGCKVDDLFPDPERVA